MKKKIAYWALYDLANSFVLIAFLFYFSQWLVIDQGKPAWWYNAALIASSLLFIISAPILSKKIDETRNKIRGLRLWSVFTFVLFLAVSLVVMLTDGYEFPATILYTLANYSYLVCFLYFTPMLVDLSTPQNRSWISGLGQGANSVGQVLGILVTIPFVNGITLFGDPGRAQALLPAVIFFGIFALPMLLWYREENRKTDESQEVRPTPNLISLFKTVFSYKPLAFIFLAYFLFSDAMLTFSSNFPLYLETVHGVSDTVKSLLTASILILSAFGAVVLGKVADKKGNGRTLKWILITWCFIFVGMALITNFKFLVPLFLFAGILFGPVWGISRAMVGQLAPPHLMASSYSYYVVAERFATFIGPALWSLTLIVMGEGARGYQAGLLSLALLLVMSLFALRKVEKLSHVGAWQISAKG